MSKGFAVRLAGSTTGPSSHLNAQGTSGPSTARLRVLVQDCSAPQLKGGLRMIDVDTGRRLLAELVNGLNSHAHRYLAQECAERGLPAPLPEQTGEDTPTLSKAIRLRSVIENVQPQQYSQVFHTFLERDALSPALRFQVEDWLWAGQWPVVNERVRREVAASIQQIGGICAENPDGLMRILGRLFVLEAEMEAWSGQTLATDIKRHVLANSGDWTVLELFERLGALRVADRRFVLFLQGLLSGKACPNEVRQRELVAAMTPALARAGMRVEESGEIDGYPKFSVVSGSSARPTQMILFAGKNAKPDLRLTVLDLQIEVMSRSSDVLSYDRPVGDEGLTWLELQAWWAQHKEELDAKKARSSLWSRLNESLPDNSPPQRALFERYVETHWKASDRHIALLPEVWLHWDPKVKSERGERAFPSQRMDFLMLLPNRRRVVLEVDGKQHYSDKEGRASPTLYAETVRADRDLRLSGYEVFRFGGQELMDKRAHRTIDGFFDRLLGAGGP